MATKVLYSATVPTAGADTRAKAYTMVPYFVSGPLSESTNITGIVGTVLHVAAWIIALVMDILLMGKLKYDKTAAEDTAMDYLLASFIPFVVAFGVVVLSIVVHATGVMQIPEDKFPPFLMTIVTAGSILCIIFTYLQLYTNAAGLHSYPSDVAKQPDFVEEWRRLVIWAILSKVAIWQFITNNVNWATANK
jgi:hypothetical protein